MNFNFSKKPEYDLHTSMIEEVINLYGVKVKFIVVERINLDDTVFGDFSHLKSDNEHIYDMNMLPETSESFDIGNYNFSEFGFQLYENCALFASAKSFRDIGIDMKKIITNLIVFPNGKVHEITDIDWQSPGINNLYTYSDQKSVYKLTTKPYEFKLNTEIDNAHIQNDYEPDDITKFDKDVETAFSQELPEDFEMPQDEKPYDKLDGYFEELLKIKKDQTDEVEIRDTVKTTPKSDDVPIRERKKNDVMNPKIESNVWNDF